MSALLLIAHFKSLQHTDAVKRPWVALQPAISTSLIQSTLDVCAAVLSLLRGLSGGTSLGLWMQRVLQMCVMHCAVCLVGSMCTT